MDYERLTLKDAAIQRRVAEFGRCYCDYCRKNIGIEYHEWIRRSYTVNNPEAREASFAQEICSLLCFTCHQTAAITKEGLVVLMDFNIKLYGAQAVYDALHAIPERLWLGKVPDIEL